MTKPRSPAGNSGHHHAPRNGVRLYTLEVVLAERPVSEDFLERNPDVSRTIEIRGDQTLQDLHEAALAAFDRGRTTSSTPSPSAPDASATGNELLPASPIGALNLRVGRRLRYHFDPEDDWTHDVKVTAVGDPAPGVKYPRVVRRVGESPPQYADGRRGTAEDSGPAHLPDAAADVSLLIGEMHLKAGEYVKAIEAFTRAIENDPAAADEYEGRARAYRALAAQDERRARELRAAASMEASQRAGAGVRG